MTDRYREQWEKLGSADPYWAVLTDPAKKEGKWESAEFYASGEAEIKRLFHRIGERGIRVTPGRAVDFGCGTGRLSRALASRFERVLAIDISSSMLTEAQSANRAIPNIEFHHNPSKNLALLEDASVDFVYSNIVLQHMPDTEQISYIREFARILKPGGAVVFQTPSNGNLATWQGWVHRLLGNRLANFFRRIRHRTGLVMEIHTLSKTSVHKLLLSQGLRIDFTERYNATGKPFDSYRYYAVKPPAA